MGTIFLIIVLKLGCKNVCASAQETEDNLFGLTGCAYATVYRT